MHHYKLIQQFRVVAEHQNITQASLALHISQPTLTQNLRRLESMLGLSLLDRRQSGIRLTQAGELLYRHAALLDNGYQHMLDAIERHKQQQQSVIRIGCGFVWSHRLLFRLLQSYIEQYPHVKFELKTGEISALKQKLLSGEYDLIFGEVRFDNQERDQLHAEPLLSTGFAVFAATSHPLQPLQQIPRQTLAQYPWIRLHHQQEDAINEKDEHFPVPLDAIKFEVSSLNTALEIAAVSQSLVQLPLPLAGLATQHGLAQLDTAHESPRYQTGVLYTQAALLSPHIKACLTCLLQSAKQALALGPGRDSGTGPETSPETGSAAS